VRLKLEGGKRRPASQERADVQAKPREAEPVVVCTEEGASRASDLVSVRASGAEDRYVADGFYRRDALNPRPSQEAKANRQDTIDSPEVYDLGPRNLSSGTPLCLYFPSPLMAMLSSHYYCI